MKSLLIVYHSQSGTSKALANAAALGAELEPGVRPQLARAWDAGAGDVITADGLLLVAAENSGSVAGGMKDFLDRIFYPLAMRELIRPYGLILSAGNDGRGAQRQVQRIVSGIPLRSAMEPLIVRGEIAPSMMQASREVGQAFAAGLVMGIFDKHDLKVAVMTDGATEQVPEGFNAVPSGLGFSDAIQPTFIRIEEEVVSFGLLVQQHHTNLMGSVHGGVLMTMADLAAAAALNVARGEKAGSPTMNLNVDFIAAGRLGQWLQADIEHISLKRRFGFSSGVISNSAGLVARFSGTFYLPDHDGMWKSGNRRSGLIE